VTYAQARQEVIRALRGLRAVYRRADTQGEKLERSLDRLITKRKKIVVSREMEPIMDKWREYLRLVKDMEVGMSKALRIIVSYEL